MNKSDEQRRITLEVERADLVSLIERSNNRPVETFRDKLAGIFLVSLMSSLIVGLLGILFGGFRGGVSERKTLPNQGIKLSIRNSAFTGITVGLITVVISGAMAGYNYRASGFKASILYGLPIALLVGIVVGLIAAFRSGGFDVIKHYSLRVILSYKGYIPKDLVGGLNYAIMLILMQRVGGGYIFIHRSLLEHFAAMDNKVSDPPATR